MCLAKSPAQHSTSVDRRKKQPFALTFMPKVSLESLLLSTKCVRLDCGGSGLWTTYKVHTEKLLVPRGNSHSAFSCNNANHCQNMTNIANITHPDLEASLCVNIDYESQILHLSICLEPANYVYFLIASESNLGFLGLKSQFVKNITINKRLL